MMLALGRREPSIAPAASLRPPAVLLDEDDAGRFEGDPLGPPRPCRSATDLRSGCHERRRLLVLHYAPDLVLQPPVG